MKQPNARAASLEKLRATTVARYLDPVPSHVALRAMFDRAGIPRFKANMGAKRGGGECRYSVAHVEKFFRSHLKGKAQL